MQRPGWNGNAISGLPAFQHTGFGHGFLIIASFVCCFCVAAFSIYQTIFLRALFFLVVLPQCVVFWRRSVNITMMMIMIHRTGWSALNLGFYLFRLGEIRVQVVNRGYERPVRNKNEKHRSENYNLHICCSFSVPCVWFSCCFDSVLLFNSSPIAIEKTEPWTVHSSAGALQRAFLAKLEGWRRRALWQSECFLPFFQKTSLLQESGNRVRKWPDWVCFYFALMPFSTGGQLCFRRFFLLLPVGRALRRRDHHLWDVVGVIKVWKVLLVSFRI